MITLIRDAELIATFDDAQRELRHASLLIEDDRIAAIGSATEITAGLHKPVDRIIDARGHVILPGLVNTHHHFYQTLTRNLPAGQNAELFDWLVTHYPIWARLDPEAMFAASQIAAAELLLSGCTTAADHTYLWPNGARIDDQIAAVSELGLRFHASRGSMSVGESQGGLPPDSVVESESAILEDTQRAIERYHDVRERAMTRVVVAPCSPFSVSRDLMRESAALAREYGVHLHTHLAETRDEEAYCREQFGCTPVEYAEQVGWVGRDVWFAHMVHPHSEEITRLGGHCCGAAHCPSSNMRLGSGIAPVMAMHRAGMRVGLGVDGSASNDGSHLLAETRQAMLLGRLQGEMDDFNARQMLWFATRGGAAVLGRDDIGQLAVGKAADIIGFRMDSLALAGGALHDPLAALVFCQPPQVDLSFVNGIARVAGGRLLGHDLNAMIARHNASARRIVEA
ncbi:8-oxoguanine deaminase [Salinicola rhizosphaerae]|uniref:8-oxoguanine deaminase n=1 Tax=Salinicola rhizosphaerae TaxID=1443141 RepID=A0ABQ3DSC9_9GAMM|nr:8-oxoguanine deaminase [Salinicola rhizosphaerae]GHB13115.1 8-oxoguanine deaminase [Salinicola rhizosphaerae]